MRDLELHEVGFLFFGIVLMIAAGGAAVGFHQVTDWLGIQSSLPQRKIVARVAQVEGVAQRKSNPSDAGFRLNGKEFVFINDVIETRSDGRLLLVLKGQDRIEIEPNTTVKFTPAPSHVWDMPGDRLVLKVLDGSISKHLSEPSIQIRAEGSAQVHELE